MLARLFLAVAVIISFASGAAEAQLAKRGNYSGVYGWFFPAEASFEADKGHFMWAGLSTGAFRNDSGEGFLHGAAVICAPNGEFVNGSSASTGYCVITDKDGDKVFSSFKCTGAPCSGEISWTGGTGKYKGIRGTGTYQDLLAGRNQLGFVGWSPWKGAWQLPE